MPRLKWMSFRVRYADVFKRILAALLLVTVPLLIAAFAVSFPRIGLVAAAATRGDVIVVVVVGKFKLSIKAPVSEKNISALDK